MKDFWDLLIRFLSFGISPSLDEEGRRRAIYTQGISFFFIVVSLAYPIYYLVRDYQAFQWLSFAMIIINCLIFFVGAIGNIQIAKFSLLLFVNLSTLFSASIWGENIDVKFAFLIYLLLPLLLFPTRELKNIFLFQALSFLCFALVHFKAIYYLNWLVLDVEKAVSFNHLIDLSTGLVFSALMAFLVYDLYLRRDNEHENLKKAEKAIEAKSRFFSTISHEIRTPLNSLIGLVELMENTKLNDEQVEYSRVIKLSAESLMSVVNGVLDYSQIEADSLELENSPFSLPQAVREVVDMLNIRAQKRGYGINYQVEESLNRNLRGDAKRLKQILINLIGNAVKFTYKGGIYVKVEDIGLDHQKQMVRISVRDTGIGIPEEKISQLFNPYTQLNRTLAEEGTGLGLAITWELVHLMGGKIWVDSQKGQGTTFAFELGFQVLESVAPTAKPYMPNPNDKNSLSILLVEDNPVNQRVVMRMLQKLGYKADLVVNGQAAIEAAGQKQYDLILMDLELPVLNGIEATKQILSRCRERSAKGLCPLVIALTANTTVEYQHQCLASGMQDFLAKPIRTNDLQQMILSWFPKANPLAEA
ncbi:MAG: ATP-binding protein [Bacteroidota bacterium]